MNLLRADISVIRMHCLEYETPYYQAALQPIMMRFSSARNFRELLGGLKVTIAGVAISGDGDVEEMNLELPGILEIVYRAIQSQVTSYGRYGSSP